MVKRGLGVGVRVRFAAVFVALAGAVVAHGAAAESNDASLSAVQRRAIAASGLPRASIVSVKPDMVVAIRNRGTPSAGGGVIEGVVLQGEVVSTNAAQVMGYRSMRSTVNVDCVRRRDLVVKMAVFSEPNAQGEVVNRQVQVQLQIGAAAGAGLRQRVQDQGVDGRSVAGGQVAAVEGDEDCAFGFG